MDIDDKTLANLKEKRVVSLAQKLIRIPSAFPSYDEVASFVRDEMKGYGLKVEVKGDSGKGWKRPNVIGTCKGSGKGPTLLLSAHTDVVPPYDLKLWKVKPYEAKIIDRVLYGRGAADTKGSLAAMLAAAEAVVKSDLDLIGDFKLVAWVGDEYHPPDAKYFDGESYLAMNDLIKGDMGIFGEPYDLKITYISRGRIWIEIEVGGEASHSATGKGINAIVKSLKLIDSIYGIKVGEHPVTGKDTINVGVIKGGVQPNMVPDFCNFIFDIRFGEHLTTKAVEDMVKEKADAMKQADPQFTLRSMKVTERREPFGFPRDSNLNESIKKAGQKIGRDLPYGGALSFGPVEDWKDRVGLKEGCLFGPGETAQAHAANEHVRIDDLVVAARVLALTIPLACGVA